MEGNVYIPIPRPAPRRGLRWSQDEEKYLLKAVRRGDSVERICDLLGRTWIGVVNKLLELHLLLRCPPGYDFVWNYPQAHRRGNVPRMREPPLLIRLRDQEQFRRFFQNFE